MKKLLTLLLLIPMISIGNNLFDKKGLVCEANAAFMDWDKYKELTTKDQIRIWCDDNVCETPYIKGYKINWVKLPYSFEQDDIIYFLNPLKSKSNLWKLHRQDLFLISGEKSANKIELIKNHRVYDCKLKKSKKDVILDLKTIINESIKKNQF